MQAPKGTDALFNRIVQTIIYIYKKIAPRNNSDTK